MHFSNFEVLSQIDPLYPGLKDTLSLKALSIKAQYHYPLQTAVDQRGEQAINVMEKLVVVSKCCLFVIICIVMVFKLGNNILYKNFLTSYDIKCVRFDSIILEEAFSYSSNK